MKELTDSEIFQGFALC